MRDAVAIVTDSNELVVFASSVITRKRVSQPTFEMSSGRSFPPHCIRPDCMK